MTSIAAHRPRAKHRSGPQSGGAVHVIGASIAGLHTAALLGDAGRPVVVHERRPRIGTPPRSLIVTPAVRRELGDVCDGVVAAEVRRFYLYADGLMADIPLAEPDLVIERASLIERLAERARRAGVEIEAGQTFAGLRASADGVELTMRSRHGEERIGTRHVVAADGAFSAVARAAGYPAPATASLIQAVVTRPRAIPPDVSAVWFRPDDTPYFYWLIPVSADRSAVGLIGARPGGRPRRLLDAFLSAKGWTPLEYQAAPVPLYRRWLHPRRRVGGGEVYAVGDAAHQVKVSTVGGVVTGVRGAAAVAAMLANGDGTRAMRALRRELDLHLWIRRSLHRFGEDDYRALLALMEGRVRDCAGRYHRDETPRLLRHVLTNQPKLLLLALRGLLGSSSFAAKAAT